MTGSDVEAHTVSLVVDLTLAAWALVELGVRVRESVHGKGRRHRDRGTRILVVLALVVVVGTAFAAPSAQSVPLLATGLCVMWLGLALRVWSIAALGGDFRTTVEVEPGQAVVSAGPYTWVRHPSYTGLLLIAAGLGVADGAWASVAACAVLLVPALVRRIHVEEAELDHVLGDAYRNYRSRTTARLIPRVW
jgi:protein-S-isoprenylcysteine O-methyltransferase Ste14